MHRDEIIHCWEGWK